MMKRATRWPINRVDLNGEWQFAVTPHLDLDCRTSAVLQSCGLALRTAVVPGNAELDLQRNGLIGEPFYAMNPETIRLEYEQQQFFYVRRFAWPAAVTERVSNRSGVQDELGEPWLVFAGLDCYADVSLDGEWLASFDNMLVEREINLNGRLLPGDHELVVRFRPVTIEARRYAYDPQTFGNSLLMESVHVRKAPHMFGWDIMPRFLSAGIFRPVWIERRPPYRLSDLHLRTLSIGPGKADLDVFFRLDVPPGAVDYDTLQLRLSMVCGDSSLTWTKPVHFIAGHIAFTLPNPRLWHPRSRGPADLYDVHIELLRDGQSADHIRLRHGVRTVALKRTALTNDRGDGTFEFYINGERLFIKGSNWVPADAFHSRDAERIPRILEMAEDLNCNMLRCWGGNVYEDDVFYEICDRAGILVWQDFTMACCIYPQDDAFAARLREEAVLVVRRLREHPCVALWAGDNECDEAYFWSHSGMSPQDNRLTRQVLPDVCRLHDGTRPYIASSPFYDRGVTAENARFTPEDHLWGPRNYFKSPYYLDSPCHFVSEIGYHGCPDPASVARFISPPNLWPPQNEEWRLHASSANRTARLYDSRIELMSHQIGEMFRDIPDNLGDFSFASQAVQAEAKKFFIERFRTQKWRRTGILWWNLMDGWPQFSDAIVDYFFMRKLAYRFIKVVQQDVCVSLTEPDGWTQNIVICVDLPHDVRLEVRINDPDSGESLFASEATAAADQATVIGSLPYIRNRQRFLIIEWSGDYTGRNHYLSGQPPFDLAQYRGWLEQHGII